MRYKQLAKLVRNRPEKYPFELERRYERVLDCIMTVWGTPNAEQCFLDLLVDARGSRQGFPIKVAEEIYFLSELHSVTFNRMGEARLGNETQRLDKADQRTAEFRAVLESRGFKFVPSEMFACISKGDLATVVAFVNAGMGIDTPNERGWTPLMVALFEGQEKVALFLIRRGADPVFADSNGYRPIHWAAFHGYVTVIRELVGRGANPSARNNYGWSPLLQAAARGYTAAVDALLELGANIDGSDREGWTALHKACANGHDEVVSALLARNAQLAMAHTDGRAPLHIAIECGQRVIAARLLREGADPRVADAEGVTALHIAAGRNDVTLVDVLLASGAARSARNRRGLTPLMCAVEAGAMPVIRRLVTAGATIDECLNIRSADEPEAARPGRAGSVVAAAARVVKSINARPMPRLHDCVARNDFEGARAEIDKGVDLNAAGPDGMTPLEIAASHGLRPMWGMLIDFGAGRKPKR